MNNVLNEGKEDFKQYDSDMHVSIKKYINYGLCFQQLNNDF